jgi:hypothetical protein
MSKLQFLEKTNVNMLWDVIADEELFKNHTTEVKNTILQLFTDNIKGFYTSETKNPKITLMEMNKKYIVMILNFIKTYYPTPTLNKIVIKEEIKLDNKELITIEERKKGRLTEFDTKLNKVEEEFKNAMALPVPETPKFSDDVKEEPLLDMEKAIKEMAEQRNYEVQQINQLPLPKQDQVSNSVISVNGSSSRLKHIKWADQPTITPNNDNIQLLLEEQDIFSKLKPITRQPNTEINTNENRLTKLEENIVLLKKDLDQVKSNISEILGLLKNK